MTHQATIACVTRSYPPVVGGMERFSFEFTEALAKKAQVLLVANRHGKQALPFFLPWAAWKLRRLARQADVIHLGDPLLTVLIPFLPSPKKPVAVTVHGLDILYQHPLYQTLIRRFLPRTDLALCISRFVEREVRQRFPDLPIMVLTPALGTSFAAPEATRVHLEKALKRNLGADPLLLAVARLVPRKGLAWFVRDVLPGLPSIQLLVIGDGPERANIKKTAERVGAASRVTMVGSANRETLRLAYSVADLLIMPNLHVPGDAEGFGIVALEAASAGLPVVAADLEGIPDAVVNGETGILTRPGDARAWVTAITELLHSPSRLQALKASAPRTLRERFAWDRRAEQAVASFSRLASKSPNHHRSR